MFAISGVESQLSHKLMHHIKYTLTTFSMNGVVDISVFPIPSASEDAYRHSTNIIRLSIYHLHYIYIRRRIRVRDISALKLILADDRYVVIMKKRGSNESKSDKNDKNRQHGSDATRISDAENLSDDENQGFGNWLRSSSGVEMMRLFVIANSILVFVTMAWPNMKESFYILKDYLVGEED